MEISLLRQASYIDSTNVRPPDNAELYVPCTVEASGGRPPITYENGDIYYDDENMYERTGGELTVRQVGMGTPAYEPTEVNEVVIVPNPDAPTEKCIAYVEALNGIEYALQPWDYATAPPTSLDFSSWAHRYVEFGDLVNGKVSRTVNGITHTIEDISGAFYYKISHIVDVLSFEPEIYNTNNGCSFSDLDTPNKIFSRVGSTAMVASTNEHPYVKQNNTQFTRAGTSQVYQIGWFKTASGGTSHYGIRKQISTPTVVVIAYQPLNMLAASTMTSVEDGAVCVNTGNCSNEWVAKTVIRNGNTIYIRTNVNTAKETAVANAPTYRLMNRMGDLSWGWTKIGPAPQKAPLDNLNYTYVEGSSPMTYTISSGINKFNTIAITKLHTDTVKIEVTPTDGLGAIPTFTVDVDMRIDEDSRLLPTTTTQVIYLPRDMTGEIKLTFEDVHTIKVGGIYIGLSANVGFTNLVFTNKFKDYSPYEKDQWGNIVYLKGVKTNIFSGTVDVHLRDYDMTNRFMSEIGGETVILNGSDNIDNEVIDDQNFFSSTMLVGRITGFALKTKLKNDVLDQMASYSFQIEENV